MSYLTIRQAIIDHASLTANYENYIRHFSPHIIGKHHNGVPIVVGFQYDGGKPGGLSPNGEWCQYLLPRLHYVRRNGDRWLHGLPQGKPMEGLSEIDIAA